MKSILNINLKELINLSYLTANPLPKFIYINYFIILSIDLFLVWVIFLYLYILKKTYKTPIYNVFRKISWISFYLCILLLVLLYSRAFGIAFLSMRLFLEIYLLILIVFIVYFAIYFLFFLKKDNIEYYKKITREKYLPKKKRNKSKKS